MNKLFGLLLIGLLSIGICGVYAADDINIDMSTYNGEIINQSTGGNINLLFDNNHFAHVCGFIYTKGGLFADVFGFTVSDDLHTIVFNAREKKDFHNEYQIAVASYDNPSWALGPRVIVKMGII